ncbi:MAG: class III signal peptide-containing protein [Candidatus Parvarchaeota archaeon]
MKGQISIEFMVIVAIIIIIVVVAALVFYNYVGKVKNNLVNETAYYYPVSMSFVVNSSGSVDGTLIFSKQIPANSLTAYFSYSNTIFSIPFTIKGFNTTYGYETFLTQSSTSNYLPYENNQLILKYITYTNNLNTFYIDVNSSVFFK